MAVNRPNSPRQKMINLMYLVFIAMLALNVSVEVLDGFDRIDTSLGTSADIMATRNRLVMEALTDYYGQNATKAEEWHRKGKTVRAMSDSLASHINALKQKMVREADGRKGDINKTRHKDDTEAASVIMLSPVSGEGKKLRKALEAYRDTLAGWVEDAGRQEIIVRTLSTTSTDNKRSWEASLFENMPLAGALTLLTKLETDVRSAEGEALESLLQQVDIGDTRVNRLNSYLIPESDIVMRGGKYNARIVLSAEDSTRRPQIVVNGERLDPGQEGFFSLTADRTGTFPIEGYVEWGDHSGSVSRRPFSGSYTVVEPAATIAPVLMNVLYAGIENEVEISVPGYASRDIKATATNGSISPEGSRWLIRPEGTGKEVKVSVSVQTGDGALRHVADRAFRVRALPDPTPFIEFYNADGQREIFKGGRISKSALTRNIAVKASIDDGILDIPFRVTGFRTIVLDALGNAIPETSDGNHFSQRQIEQARRLKRGAYLYLSGLRAVGPDGVERELSVMELQIQ